MCPQCRAFISNKDKVCPYCGAAVSARAVDRRSPGDVLRGLLPGSRFVTSMLLVVNGALFLVTVIQSMQVGNSDAFGSLDLATLTAFGAKNGPRIVNLGEWWRLITAGFLHGGFIHIAMNSFALLDVGSQVEEVYGTSRMLVIYFVATVAGFLASLWWSPLVLSVGASAGIFGLIGAMIAVGVRYKSPMGDLVRGIYLRWALYGLLLGFLPFFRVDNAAHIGGLAAGFLVAYAAGMPLLVRGTREQIWQVLAGICLLLTAYAFVQMFLTYNFLMRQTS